MSDSLTAAAEDRAEQHKSRLVNEAETWSYELVPECDVRAAMGKSESELGWKYAHTYFTGTTAAREFYSDAYVEGTDVKGYGTQRGWFRKRSAVTEEDRAEVERIVQEIRDADQQRELVPDPRALMPDDPEGFYPGENIITRREEGRYEIPNERYSHKIEINARDLELDENVYARQKLGEGTKHDDGKPRLALIPYEAVFAAGRALTYGAVTKGYEEHNWRKGLSVARLAGALLRHLFAFLGGEDRDQESGLCHLDHVMACAMMLTATYETRPDMDDRYRKAVAS